MLGVTVLIDVVVLLLYSISSSIANAECDPEAKGFQILDLLITAVCITFAVLLGYIVGKFLIFCIWIPHVPGEYIVLPLGFGIFQFSSWFLAFSTDKFGHGINFDPLLICIAAGYIVANHSRNRRKFLRFLGKVGPLIFIPFFTLTGASLKLMTLATSFPFAALVFITRASCYCAGVFIGGIYSKDQMPMEHIKTMWLAMITQAGVSLGIAAEVAIAFASSWGAQFQSVVISVILLNQIFGPILSKWAIKKNGEDNQANMDEEDDEHRIKKALLIGCNPSAVALTQRLLDVDWDIIILDTDEEKFHQLQHLRIPIRKRSSVHEIHTIKDPHQQNLADAANEAAKEATEALGEEKSESEGGLTVEEALRREAGKVEGSGSLSLPVDDPDDPFASQAPISPRTRAAQTDDSSSPSSASLSSPSSYPTSFPATPHGSTFTTFSSSANSRVITRLISPIRLEHTSGSNRLNRQTDEEKALKLGVEIEVSDCTTQNTDVALVMLDTDAKTYTICNYLLDSLHLKRVLAVVHNPNWASMFASIGVLPIFPFSINISLLFKTCTTPPNAHVDLINPKHALHISLAQLIQPDSIARVPFHLAEASSSELAEFLAQHPNPPLPVEDLWKFDFKMKVVNAAVRDEYVNAIHGVHESKAALKMTTRQAMNKAAVTFTGPGLGSDELNDDEEEAPVEEYKNPHHDQL